MVVPWQFGSVYRLESEPLVNSIWHFIKPTHSGNPFFQPPYALALLLCVGRFFVRFDVVAGAVVGRMGAVGDVVGR